MRRAGRTWRRRSQAERFDGYTRWSLYLLSAAPALAYLLLLLASVSLSPMMVIMTGPVLLHTVICLRVLHDGLRATSSGLPTDRLLLLVWVLVSAGSAAAVQIVFTADSSFGQYDGLHPATFVVVLASVAALTPRFRWFQFLLVCGLALPIGLGWSVRYAVMYAACLFAYWTSIWILRIMWQLDRSREVAARLAVAEERLRFSRDLHDVFGRTLSAVALKSELAAELARRRSDQSVTTMLEVRQLAQDSLKEVREVVGGYRAVDLAAELRGARSILQAAGVDCMIIGGEQLLPEEVQTALAWAIREAATNVVRHSDAKACTIALSTDESGCSLVITNDGVAAEQSVPGTGLVGLGERLAALNGTVDAGRESDSFTLTVVIPVLERS